mmetsp:Transcript_7717/g.21071  ORF Transcript_7717/g.21071 Transcript_7717/m.21071 type:complete len:290 (-) Transcript_7717:2411-3280(-)
MPESKAEKATQEFEIASPVWVHERCRWVRQERHTTVVRSQQTVGRREEGMLCQEVHPLPHDSAAHRRLIAEAHLELTSDVWSAEPCLLDQLFPQLTQLLAVAIALGKSQLGLRGFFNVSVTSVVSLEAPREPHAFLRQSHASSERIEHRRELWTRCCSVHRLNQAPGLRHVLRCPQHKGPRGDANRTLRLVRGEPRDSSTQRANAADAQKWRQRSSGHGRPHNLAVLATHHEGRDWRRWRAEQTHAEGWSAWPVVVGQVVDDNRSQCASFGAEPDGSGPVWRGWCSLDQ